MRKHGRLYIMILQCCLEAVSRNKPMGILCPSPYMASQISKKVRVVIHEHFPALFEPVLTVRVHGPMIEVYPKSSKKVKPLASFKIPEGMDEKGFVEKVEGGGS